MVPSWIKSSDVSSVEEDSSFIRIIKPLNHWNYGTFSTSRCTNQRNNTFFLIINFNRYSFKDLNIFFTWISKFNVFNFDCSFNFFNNITASCVNFRFILHHLNNLIRCSKYLHDITKDTGKNSKVYKKQDHIKQKWSDWSDIYFSIDI